MAGQTTKTQKLKDQRARPPPKTTATQLLSCTTGEPHTLVQSLIHGKSGFDAWRHLNLQYFGVTEARRYTTLKLAANVNPHSRLGSPELVSWSTHEAIHKLVSTHSRVSNSNRKTH
eukprot:2752827-Amphidinium_carterae.1